MRMRVQSAYIALPAVDPLNMTPLECRIQVVQLTMFTIILFAIAYSAGIAGYASRFDKEPQHTSRLSGEDWVQELLEGHEDQIYNELEMHRSVFLCLLWVLQRDAGVHATRHVSAEEQLSIFLHYCMYIVASPIRRCRNASNEVEIPYQSVSL
jgi:hypothetical protein